MTDDDQRVDVTLGQEAEPDLREDAATGGGLRACAVLVFESCDL